MACLFLYGDQKDRVDKKEQLLAFLTEYGSNKLDPEKHVCDHIYKQIKAAIK
jgi:hypothetical protein